MQTRQAHGLIQLREVHTTAAERRRDEQQHLVDEAFTEKRCRERRSAFEQQRLNAVTREAA